VPEKASSPSRTRTSDSMINSHAQWVNRERLQQTRIIISVIWWLFTIATCFRIWPVFVS